MLGVAASGLVVLATASGIVFAEDARVRGPIVRLGDVANLEALPGLVRTRAAALELAALPVSKAPISLSVKALEARARALMPALAPYLSKSDASVLIRRRSSDRSALIASGDAQGIAKGDDVRVSIMAGIFSIERQGIAMSDAKPGEGLFVRTTDGKALSARCCGD